MRSAVLYNRANFIIRQYATAARSFSEMKPLYDNQMSVYRLVYDTIGSTKYLGDNRWLTYNAIDRILKISKDKAYYSLPAQANQQVLKLLLRDYRSFFEALKAYRSNPGSFTGRPRLPKYVKEKGLKTIAFPLISAGVYGYPQRDAIKVAVETMKLHQDDFDEITLLLFGEREFGFEKEDYSELC